MNGNGVMSTQIDDLPGPQPEIPIEIQRQLQSLEVQPPQSNIEMVAKKEPKQVHFSEEVEVFGEEQVVPQAKGAYTFMMEQVNEENLLLLGVLYLALLPNLERHFYSIPVLGNYTYGNGLFAMVLKAFLLLVIFVVVREFVLPYFKL